jgi:hypothetical protein
MLDTLEVLSDFGVPFGIFDNKGLRKGDTLDQ